VEFRRVDNLPPYVFAVIRDLTLELRRAGHDVVDLGFGNPDLPSPELAVEKLAEAARNPRNHRYSASKGIPNLRLACANLYRRKFGVELDPDTQVLNTIGAKEGLSHRCGCCSSRATRRSSLHPATRSTSTRRSSPVHQ
jgi:alanine-synthesizing transaminase